MNNQDNIRKKVVFMAAALSFFLLLVNTAFAETIVLPEKTTIIEAEAFFNDAKLEEVVLPEGITHIGEKAFACSGLKEINLPSTLEDIAQDAFDNTNLHTVYAQKETYAYTWLVENGYENRIWKAPEEVFVYNISGDYAAITQYTGTNPFVKVPEELDGYPVKMIDSYAFMGLNFIDTVYLPSSVEFVQMLAFGNSSVKHVYLPMNPLLYENTQDMLFQAFWGSPEVVIHGLRHERTMDTFAANFMVYETYKEVGKDYIFDIIDEKSCGISAVLTQKETVAVPEKSPEGRTVIAIFDEAFKGDRVIKTCKLTDKVRSIGKKAFANSTLENLHFFHNLQEIAGDAFETCTMVTGRGADGSYASEFFRSNANTRFKKVFDGTRVGDFYFLALTEDTCMIEGYEGTGTALTLPQTGPNGETVVEIGEEVFNRHTELTGELVIPDTITKIGDYAFSGTAFSVIHFPSSVTFIGENVFQDCPVFHPEVEENTYAWQYCDANFYLTRNDAVADGMQVTLQGNNTYIITKYVGSGEDAKLPSYINNRPVTAIADDAFSGTAISGKLKLPERLTAIGKNAFLNCTGLTGDLILPESVTSIGTSAFQGCSGLDGRLELPPDITVIPEGAFRDCAKLNGKLVIPDGVVQIHMYAFLGCRGFDSLKLSETLYSIGGGAFTGCSGLSGELKLPETLQYIQSSNAYFAGKKYDGAFEGCYNLTGPLTLPEGLKEIGAFAFKGCSGFTGPLVIPEGISEIGEMAFYSCKGFESLSLPDTLITIQGGAFGYCSGMKGTLELPASLVAITECYKGWMGVEHTGAFQGCTGFTGVLEIPAAMTTIEANVFMDCSGLEELSFGQSVLNRIGSSAFAGCSSLSGSLKLPSSLTTLENNAFQYCANLTGEVEFPDALTTLGSYVFSGCSGLTGTVILPKNLTAVPAGLFQNCTGVTGVEFHDGILAIHDRAFSNTQLTGALVLPEKLQTLGYGSFFRCRAITELVIPETVTVLPERVFSECTNLKTMKLTTEKITSIGLFAFMDCINLEGTFVFPGNTQIGGMAFYNCPKMEVISDMELEGIRAEAVDALLAHMNNEVLVPDQMISIMKADESDTWFTFLINAAVDVMGGNFDDIIRPVKKEEYLFEQALKFSDDGTAIKLAKLDLVGEPLKKLNSAIIEDRNIFYNELVIMSGDRVKNVQPAAFKDLFEQYNDRKITRDQYEQGLVLCGLQQEDLQDVCDISDFLSELSIINDVVKKLEEPQKKVNGLINIWNQLQMVSALDTKALEEASRIYLQSEDEVIQLVGVELKAMAVSDPIQRITLIATGKFMHEKIDKLVNKACEKVVASAISASLTATVTITNKILDSLTGVGDIPRLTNELFYSADAVRSAYAVFQKDLEQYKTVQTSETFDTIYWDYLTYLRVGKQSLDAFVALYKNVDDAKVGDIFMTEEARCVLEWAQSQSDILKLRIDLIQGIYDIYKTGDTIAFRNAVKALEESKLAMKPYQGFGGGGGGGGGR